jgi:hypothetical protein
MHLPPEQPVPVQEQFWERGYAVIPDLASASQLAFLRAAIEVSERHGRLVSENTVVPQGALDEYSAPAAEMLLTQAMPAIETVIGQKLLPTYAYWRIYHRGAELSRHVDRESCEISATLPIFAEPAQPAWSIYFKDQKGEKAPVALLPGSAAIYRGPIVPHWREAFTGMCQYQIFLHYVLSDGEHAALAFDRRSGLSIDRVFDI